MIQSDFGNFELLVPQVGPNGQRLVHYFRDNSDLNNPVWRVGLPDIPFPSSEIAGYPIADSIAFFQSNKLRSGTNANGNFEVLVHFKDIIIASAGRSGITELEIDYLATYYFDWREMSWVGPFLVMPDGSELAGLTGRPTYVEAGEGGYYIAVQQGDHIGLYSSDLSTYPNLSWRHVADIPTTPDFTIGQVSLTADSISLFASPNFGGAPIGFEHVGPSLELLVHFNETRIGGGGTGLTHSSDYLAAYHFDWYSNAWVPSITVAVDGKPVEGVARF